MQRAVNELKGDVQIGLECHSFQNGISQRTKGLSSAGRTSNKAGRLGRREDEVLQRDHTVGAGAKQLLRVLSWENIRANMDD